jgi:hypothetical protein
MEETEDNYELICQSTDDDRRDMRENVLVPENKSGSTESNLNFTFNDFLNSIFFQILVAVFAVYILYYCWKFILAKVSSSSKSAKVGGNRR